MDPILALILVAGLALRLWGVGDKLPDSRLADIPWDDTTVDEGDRRAMMFAWQMWYGDPGRLHLNPGTGDWPGLPFYLTLGSQVAYRAYDALLRPGSDGAAFARRVKEHPAEIFLAARLPSVVLGVWSLFLIYRLGVLLGGRRAGRFAAGFLAIMPFHVFSSQRVSDPNLLSLVFMTAASISLVEIVRRGAMRDSLLAGAWIGLAGASKYLPLVLLGPLALAHVGPRGGERGPRVSVRWRPLAAGVAAAALAFALTSPFTFLDWSNKARDVKAQEARHMAEWAGISAHARALPTYLVETLPGMMTWAGYLLAVAGCVLLWRRGRAGRILVLIPILFVAGVGALGLAQPRFVFPATGILALAAAVAAIEIADRLSRLRPSAIQPARTAAAIPLLIFAGFGAWGLSTAAATKRSMTLPDSRHAAYTWIVRSVHPNAMLALDSYGPVFREGADGRRAVLWPFHTFRPELIRTATHPEWLDGIRYYLTSSEVTRRFEGSDPRYETERSFYSWIHRNGTKVWSTDPAATFGPQLDLYELPRVISTRGTRDSLWQAARGDRRGRRIASWTADLAQNFLWSGDAARAEEWARRGLELSSEATGASLTETLSMALIEQGDAAGAEKVAREGLRLYPRSPLLHLFHAMALEALARPGEALEAYRLALPLSPNEGSRAYVENAIRRLTAGR